MRPLSFVVAALLLALTGTGGAAMELLMFRQVGCAWCAAWDREIGPIYPKTEIGHRAPVRFVDIAQARDFAAELTSPVRFTPTFVLLDGGREIGRIEGYPGQDFFWPRLEALATKPATTGGLTLALPPHRAEGER